jgi:hypothetical protein
MRQQKFRMAQFRPASGLNSGDIRRLRAHAVAVGDAAGVSTPATRKSIDLGAVRVNGPPVGQPSN